MVALRIKLAYSTLFCEWMNKFCRDRGYRRADGHVVADVGERDSERFKHKLTELQCEHVIGLISKELERGDRELTDISVPLLDLKDKDGEQVYFSIDPDVLGLMDFIK